jgi:hypothetical protein
MDVEISDVKIGKSYVTEEVHFSGGLKGKLTHLGWALFPVSDDENSDAIVFRTPKDHLDFATEKCGLRYLGTCMKYLSGTNSPPMEVWEFGARDPQNGLGAADSWGTIGHQAAKAGDTRYAEAASYVRANLTAAGLRLRDVSNGYNDQLNWALAEKRAPGTWFSNAALQDLYADFHALASELSSARDHIATIAAIHVGAPDRIESLSRLEEWIERPVNQSHAANPMVRALLDALGSKAAPGWLRRMGDLRNEMLHRIPMSANRSVAGLVLEQIQTSLGIVSKIRLAEPLNKAPLSEQQQDPLISLSQFSSSLEMLCRTIWKHAKYPAEPLHFGSKAAT